jgi:hypothetical protein
MMSELDVMDAPPEAAAAPRSHRRSGPYRAFNPRESARAADFGTRARGGLPINGDPLSPEMVVRAAQRAGFSARWHKLAIDEISPLNLPCLVLLNENSACVVTAIDDGEIEMLLPQPGADPIRLPTDEFRGFFTRAMRSS